MINMIMAHRRILYLRTVRDNRKYKERKSTLKSTLYYVLEQASLGPNTDKEINTAKFFKSIKIH